MNVRYREASVGEAVGQLGQRTEKIPAATSLESFLTTTLDRLRATIGHVERLGDQQLRQLQRINGNPKIDDASDDEAGGQPIGQSGLQKQVVAAYVMSEIMDRLDHLDRELQVLDERQRESLAFV